MKIAHLILAHNNPGQLARLINKLQHPDADIYIHLDRKVNIEPYLNLTAANVYFIKNRVKVYWGAYSIVQATINGFTQIIATNKPYNYINLLSGHDYPIKSITQIHNYLAADLHKVYMEYLTEDSEWWQKIKSRVTQYHLTDFHFPGHYDVQTFINKVMPIRKAPAGLKFAGRSQWMTLPLDAVVYIIDYINNNPKVASYFRLTWGADEIMLQTILYNSHFSKNIVNNNLRFIDWSDQLASPKTFTMADVPQLLNSPALFARKFDMDTQPQILDYLDSLF